METMVAVGSLVVLLPGSFYDLKTKKIPIWVLGLAAVLAVVCAVVSGSLLESFWGMLPGCGLLLLSLVTEEKIGTGDGLLLIFLGIMEGFLPVLFLFGTGLFLQSLVAVGLVVLKRADRQSTIPFVPFLLLARIIMLFL